LDSNKLKVLEDYLEKKRVKYVKSFHARGSSDLVLLTVRQSAIGRRPNAKQPSRRQLSFLAKAIKQDLNIDVEFLIAKDEEQQDIEAGLNSLVRLHFPGFAQSCLLSLADDGSMNVWLERAEGKTTTLLPELESVIRDYLQFFKIQLGKLCWMDFTDTSPSVVEIVRMVKILAPVTISQIEDALSQSGSRVPSTSWLQNKLDLARKRHLLIRNEDGRYVLTETGLTLIPHGTGASSSDVHRALALGRRKW
jgi:hypothetical protein